jgi:signal peptidase II
MPSITSVQPESPIMAEPTRSLDGNPSGGGEAGSRLLGRGSRGTAPPRPVALGLGIAVIIVALDQATKWWLLLAMQQNDGRFIEVTDFFDIVLVWNRGVSFGMFNNDAGLNGLLFSLLAAVIVVALLVWLRRAASPLIVIAIGLVIGGAVGNVIDRLRLGAVVDFLDFHLGSWHWPAFNVADAAICVGVGLMIVDGLLTRREASI